MSESAETNWDKDAGSSENSEAREESAERGGYLGFVAHEVRNPLSTALWTAELLARMAPEERGGARGEKLSSMCLRSLSRVRQLVEDHFLCERLDAGGLPMRPEPLALADVLTAVIAKKPVEPALLESTVDGAIELDADRGLLERILESLVAVAGRSGGAVRLRARRDGDAVEVVVSGDAPPPEGLADPKKGSASDQKGRALSLSVSRRVAEALGGSLAIANGAYVLTLRVMGDTPQTP